MLRLVFDTDVMLAALRSPSGASRVLLQAAGAGAMRPLASVPMFLEYEDVLKRPTSLHAMKLSTGDVDRFLDAWAAIIEPVESHWFWRPSIRDPNDELFVDCAMNGGADMIVTFNLADYRLSDPKGMPLQFSVCRPGDVLRRLTWRP